MSIMSAAQDDPMVEETIKYVSVPVEKEVIVKVPKTQYMDRIVEVPRVEYQYVDRVVEVPRVNFVTKVVEKVEYVDKQKHVPVKKLIEVPRDVITYVPKVDVRVVEKEVEVPGPVIQVPKRVEVLSERQVNKYIDREVPTVVAQACRPKIEESKDHVQTARLRKYVPYLIPVEVHVPVAVDRDLLFAGQTDYMKPVTLPDAQYNAQLRNLNPGLPEDHLKSLYHRNADGNYAIFDGPGTRIAPPLNQPLMTTAPPPSPPTPSQLQTQTQTQTQSQTILSRAATVGSNSPASTHSLITNSNMNNNMNNSNTNTNSNKMNMQSQVNMQSQMFEPTSPGGGSSTGATRTQMMNPAMATASHSTASQSVAGSNAGNPASPANRKAPDTYSESRRSSGYPASESVHSQARKRTQR